MFDVLGKTIQFMTHVIGITTGQTTAAFLPSSNRTVYIPGALGIGTSSLLGRVFPYFRGLGTIEIVDVGPFTCVDRRAHRLLAYLRKPKVGAPLWSETNPINLVGHSLGCNTIFRLLQLLEEDPDADPTWISSIVHISPASSGTVTHGFGRHGRYNRTMQMVVVILKFYEMVVPEWVRVNLLFNSLLPDDGFDLRNSLVFDIDEVVSRTLSTSGFEIVRRHEIPIHTIITRCTVKDVGGNYRIPYYYGLQPIARVTGWFFGFGGATDGEVGRSAVTESTVGEYRMQKGHHDGILTVDSQMVGIGDTPYSVIEASHMYANLLLNGGRWMYATEVSRVTEQLRIATMDTQTRGVAVCRSVSRSGSFEHRQLEGGVVLAGD